MTPSQAFESNTVVGPGGSVTVEGLPFDVGESVRVIVLGQSSATQKRYSEEELERSRQIRESLRGSLLRYDDPFEPAVPPEEWDVLKDDAS